MADHADGARVADFYFDVVSPYTWLASTQLDGIEARTGARFVWKPMFLGGLFAAIGNRAPAELRPRGAFMFKDLQRWAAHYDVPYAFPRAFPIMTLMAQRAVVAAPEGQVPTAARALMRAYWADGKDISKPDVVAAALDAAGLDGAAQVAATNDPQIKARLKATTDEAQARGVFGAPSFIVDGELYWGNDRLFMVEAALAAPSATRA